LLTGRSVGGARPRRVIARLRVVSSREIAPRSGGQDECAAKDVGRAGGALADPVFRRRVAVQEVGEAHRATSSVIRYD